MSLPDFIIKISYHIIVYYLEYCRAYREVLIFYADQLRVMGNSKNLRVFNFAMLLQLQKIDAHEIHMFYSKVHYTAK